MKPLRRTVFLLFLIFTSLLALSAQDSSQSLGDFARQERERKQQQSANPAQMDASETEGLKPASFKANILVTDTHDAIEKWVLMPAADKAGAGRIRQVTPGKKYYLPFVVTDYAWQPSEKMLLTAHVQFVSPAGKLLFAAAKVSGALAPDPKSPSVIVLNPVVELTLDTDDLPGVYTIRVTITDHVHSVFARAEEQFQLVLDSGTDGKAALKAATAPPTER